jgi:teichuronic acid biosynthesis glycosyltransferase TuaG
MPKVSVVVTTFNRKDFLTETINSILTQTFPNFELIVVDNCSNYNFFEHILSFCDNRIKAFQNPNNGIIAVNRNFGIRQAKGEYVAFCDDDDIWMSDKLEVQLKWLIEKKCDLVYSNTKLYFETGVITNSNYCNKNTINKLLISNQITLSSVVVRKDKRVLFNENIELIAIEDYELWIRLILSDFKFGFIPKTLVRYRVLNSSTSRLSRSNNEVKNVKFRFSLYHNYYELSKISKIINTYNLLLSTLRYVVFLILKL